MWSEEDVKAAKVALFQTLTNYALNYPEHDLSDVWSEGMRAALNAVSGWRTVDENTPVQEPVQATTQLDDGTWAETSVVYYEPYDNLGWLCARTHVPVKRVPTLWAPLLQPPTDLNASATITGAARSEHEQGRLDGLREAVSIVDEIGDAYSRKIEALDSHDPSGKSSKIVFARGSTAFRISEKLRERHPDLGPPPEE